MPRFKTLQLKITLLETKPSIWRRIVIPAGFNFYQLHRAIQAAFGWENSHLFEFGKHGLNDPDGIGIPNDEMPVKDARRVKLSTIFRKVNDKYTYVYDFGDHWQHQVVLEEITDKEIYTAYCIGGKNECPPEDVGNIRGYQAMVDTFTHGTTAEKRSYRQWLGLRSNEDWDPTYYNQREVNKRMALVAPEDWMF